MANFPEEGRFERGKMDRLTGAQWVHVTPEMARAHPQGNLSPMLWIIVIIFVGAAGFQLWETLGGVGRFSWVGVLLKLCTAILLVLRAPYALVLAMVQLIFSVFTLATFLADGISPFAIVELIFVVFAVSYLMEGDRPNLIYRHRFRSYPKGE